MLPDPLPPLQAFLDRLRQSSAVTWAPIVLAAGLALALPGMAQAAAQDAVPAPSQTAEPPSLPIAFEADTVSYDSDADTVTVGGEVILRRDGQEVRADTVTWNRGSGEIVASGNIRFTDADGNRLYTPRMVLTDELRAGAMEELLMAFAEGGRMAARKAVRNDDGRIVMTDAAYSGCAVVDPKGCDKKPSWRVIANRVIYDPVKKRIRFLDARLEMFGMQLLPLPGLHVNTEGRATSGLLIPNFGVSKSNGVEVSSSYYARLGTNRDLTLTAFGYSQSAPMLRARYRALTEDGAYQLTGYVTHSNRIPIGTGSALQQRDLRGYFAANGRFQLSPEWSVTGSARYASDRTFLRRYDINRDDRLRSTINVERIDSKSYLSIAGWATQTLRFNDSQGQVPIALPEIDYRRRLASPVMGGRVEFQANSLAITRTGGQDSQRAFAQGRWDMRRLTGMGQEVTLTGLVRGDIYHSTGNGLTQTAIYRGQPGWKTRGVALGAIDVKWPLIGAALGGTQVLTPRLQLVATPRIRNLAVPNEDARAIDLEDSNLFALNRFPGYDRIEDGVRFTYGVDWQLDRPSWQIKTTIGQSYRLSNKPGLLPDGTGLDSRFSDYVGRTEIRYRDFLKLTHRFRVDKDSLAFRRNEFDAAFGSKKTYVEIAYLRLNRNIAAGIEDLRDREEVRLSTRVAFARYWSLFGSGVFNLTDKKEDPTLTSDGFDPLRTRLGIAYQDDCMEVGLTWRRDYANSGDARRGNTFQVYFGLKNLGLP
jgi:LPS-assembly protein